MRTAPAALAVALLVAVTALGAPAYARDPVAAEALFRSGREAMKSEDYATACAKFSESQKLDPAGGTALNLAQCEEKQGHVASAWQRLREAIDLLPPDDDRVPFARKRVTELEPRVPHLTVRLSPSAPPGTRVVRDDIEQSGALFGFPQPIDPGRHVVRTSAPGYADRVMVVDSSEATSAEIVVEPGERIGARALARRRTAGWIVGGVGVAATGVGVVTGLAAIARKNDKDRLCPNDVCSTAEAADEAHGIDSLGKTQALVSTVAFVVGAVGLGVGTALVLTSLPSKESAPSPVSNVSVAPMVSPHAASLSISGSF